MLALHTPESCVPGPTFALQHWGAQSISPESIGPETLPVGKPLAHGPRPSLDPAPTPPARAPHPEEKLRYSVARRVVEWTRRLRLQQGDPPQPCPLRTRPSRVTNQGRPRTDLRPLSRDPSTLLEAGIYTQLRATDLLCRVPTRKAKPTDARREHTSFPCPRPSALL